MAAQEIHVNRNPTVGLATTTRITIDEPRTIDFMGDEARIYATPELVRDIEVACRNLLLEHIDEGQDSVGTRIDIQHIAATPIGAWVEITATVTEIDGRALSFEISGRDAVEQICRGEHGRFIVDVARSAERLRSKIAKLGAL
jgi:predicted thioesterase